MPTKRQILKAHAAAKRASTPAQTLWAVTAVWKMQGKFSVPCEMQCVEITPAQYRKLDKDDAATMVAVGCDAFAGRKLWAYGANAKVNCEAAIARRNAK